ncbi:protelomerase family protein [Dendronalium sp. ChiSLP03b]|uniref:protelomerase family protein n=1 Tax=Dendronalium sp. ChiSLP03b TaxID=3075381 RepID=UPI00391B1D53
MSQALQDKVNELFEATKDLQSLEEIKPYCEQFNQWINQHTNYSIKSLGTVLSRVGFYKKFKSLPLEQDKNADSVPKHDTQGNVTGYELKHYVLLLCGLDPKDWDKRNQTTRVSLRLESKGQEINPDTYLQITGELLDSNDVHKVAVGLIAATGRRPHEIVARAKFAPIKGEAYQVMFTGQGKKRGENPVFPIATLYPASYIIERLNWFRQQPSTEKLLAEVVIEHPKDIEAQNRAIDSRRNGSLNRVVRDYFGDEGDENPVLPFRQGEDNSNCKALRAAYLALATGRDFQGSTGSKMLHAARLAGHFVKENPNDRDLQHLVTTLGYTDYYTTQPVAFPGAPKKGKSATQKEKLSSIRVKALDLEAIRKLQEELEAPNQQSVITRLVEFYNNRLDVDRQLQETKQKLAQQEAHTKQLEEINNKLQQENNQLKQEKTAMETVTQQPQTVTLNITELEAWLEKKVVEIVNKVAGGTVAPATPTTLKTVVQPKEEIDWTIKSDAQVWGSKAPGAALEKIRRSYQAICQYNDTVATSSEDRLAITNQALRDLSGCNGLLVRDWIEEHKDEVISHNAKYGMENKKDPSNPASYANKGKHTDKILSLINDEFLSAEGFRRAN